MNRDVILKELSKHQVELQSRFGVESLSLFGSVARNEAISASDLDILVTFINTPGLFGFIDLKVYLENLFKYKKSGCYRGELKIFIKNEKQLRKSL